MSRVSLTKVDGYSKIYHNVEDYGMAYLVFSIVLFTLFSDCLIYFIHRGLDFNSLFSGFHHPSVYSWLHKPHHSWKIATPFSGFAFHPLDGFGQSLPYHIFPFFFPMQAHLFIVLFVGVQVSVSRLIVRYGRSISTITCFLLLTITSTALLTMQSIIW